MSKAGMSPVSPVRLTQFSP